MAKLHSKKTGQSPRYDSTNYVQQIPNQDDHSMDITFLQPSIVYQSPQPTEHGIPLQQIWDENADIPAPLSDRHIWCESLQEDMDIRQHIHPSILSQLKPCKTKDDHNCLYNAICLCLGMPESQQNVLREKTASCLIKYSNHFEELLKASDATSLQALIEQCKQPFCFEGWGNEFHILALAIMLKRNIIVYTTFKNPNGQFYQRKNKNIVGLAEDFKQGGEKIEQHMNFQPQEGVTGHNPIFLHFNGSHFTSLVPRLPHPVSCIPPATMFPSVPDNGIYLQNSTKDSKKMTRKARWLASKTPAQLAEYKAREKAKKEKKKSTSEQSRHTMQTLGKTGKESTEHVPHDNYHGKKRVTKDLAPVLSPSAKEDIEKNESVLSSTSVAKMTRSEINRQYYEENRDKIKKARTRRYNDPIKRAAELAKKKAAYSDPVKHAEKLGKRKAAYSDPIKREVELAKKKAAYSDPVKHASKLGKRKAAYSDPIKRAAELAKKRAAYSDPVKQASKLGNRKAAYSDPIKRAAELAQKRAAYRDPVKHAEKLHKRKVAYAVPEKRIAELAAKNKAYRDPVKHAAELARKKAAYAVPEKRKSKLTGKRKFNENPANRELVLAKRRIVYKTKLTKQKDLQSDYTHLLSQARKAMMEMPVLACTVCHRARFKEQVKLCHRSKYPQSELVLKCFTGKYIHQCATNCSDSSIYHARKKKEWICFTCHRHLVKGNMPPQAVINNLWLDEIPEELKTLNALEMHLVSIVQPFMKIVPLPRGGQKGVRGQMVCVPANLQRTADSLPWTLNTNSLIRVKLKRKQEYKGHHLYMVVSQKRVMAALKKLMEINPAYEGMYNCWRQIGKGPIKIYD